LEYKLKTIIYHSDNEFRNFKKIFILVNQNTSSSAEIFALSLKMNLDNVLIVGSKTFGKDVGQTTIVDKQYKFILNFTTFHWNVNGYTTKDMVIKYSEFEF